MPNKVKQFLEQASLEKVYIGLKNNSISLKDFVDVVLSKQDCILFGPPGTSKTYYVDKLAEKLGDKVGLFQIIQFHANYSYDEFIDGIVPDIDKGGFKYETGVFYNFCQEAQNPPNKEKICVFVIDEINRANVTSVFGEVMNLIENKGVRIMKTAKQRKIFFVPDNVVIVGTMNTADKTLAKLDFALRRRFRFLPVYPSKYRFSWVALPTGASPSVWKESPQFPAEAGTAALPAAGSVSSPRRARAAAAIRARAVSAPRVRRERRSACSIQMPPHITVISHSLRRPEGIYAAAAFFRADAPKAA